MRTMAMLAWAASALLLLSGCGGEEGNLYQSGGLKVSSPAFPPGGKIPVKHAMSPEGRNVSPPIEWSGAPAGAKAFAVLLDDPDAGPPVFVHWVVWNVPATAKGLPENVLPDAVGLVQGKNGFGDLGYGGPKPPPGKTHKYAVSVYALDVELSLPAGATADRLIEAMQGHVLATGRLVAEYP